MHKTKRQIPNSHEPNLCRHLPLSPFNRVKCFQKLAAKWVQKVGGCSFYLNFWGFCVDGNQFRGLVVLMHADGSSPNRFFWPFQPVGDCPQETQTWMVTSARVSRICSPIVWTFIWMQVWPNIVQLVFASKIAPLTWNFLQKLRIYKIRIHLLICTKSWKRLAHSVPTSYLHRPIVQAKLAEFPPYSFFELTICVRRENRIIGPSDDASLSFLQDEQFPRTFWRAEIPDLWKFGVLARDFLQSFFNQYFLCVLVCKRPLSLH